MKQINKTSRAKSLWWWQGSEGKGDRKIGGKEEERQGVPNFSGQSQKNSFLGNLQPTSPRATNRPYLSTEEELLTKLKTQNVWWGEAKPAKFCTPKSEGWSSVGAFYGLILSLFLLIAHHSSLIAQVPQLTENSKVSLITIGPGKDLYSVFGHAGLWVSDPTLNIDRVYSYGTFDFNTDNFYVKFVRGTLPYEISVATLPQNIDFYRREGRSVTENILKLTLLQRQRLFDSLEVNLLPQNKQYRYRFFYDNCATRLRDKVMMATKDSISYSDVEDLWHSSYREWMNRYLGEKPWAKLGMNLALGKDADETASMVQAMYLPDNLQLAFQKARILTNRHVLHLVGEIRTLVPATPTPPENIPFWQMPVFFFLLIFLYVLYVTYRHWKTKVSGYWLDQWFFGFLGVLGWLLLLLWVATDHGVTTKNFSLLWALPIHIPAILLMKERDRPTWHWIYYLAVALAAGVGMLMCKYLAEDVMPLIGCIFVRCFFHFGLERRRRRVLRRYNI